MILIYKSVFLPTIPQMYGFRAYSGTMQSFKGGFSYGSFCDYIWGFSGGKTILYQGHDKGAIPVSNGLSDRISKDLKKRGFKYVGAVTIYSHLQACGIINDHDKDCTCYVKINKGHPTIRKRRDHEVM